MTTSKLELPFAKYIEKTQKKINDARIDAQAGSNNAKIIVDANSPFELFPLNTKNNPSAKRGALLIHGLFDCPFSLKDLGYKLQAQGILSKAILLPGHGTQPKDLMHVHFQQWIDIVRYGIDAVSAEVDEVYLIGYSTGATLAAYHALTDERINGLILLSPAIKIKTPVDIIVGMHKFLKLGRGEWLFEEEETDYAKYQSIPFNAVKQVSGLIEKLLGAGKHHQLACPLFMILSYEDETISAQSAIELFMKLHHPQSKLLLYSANKKHFADDRILVRKSVYPQLHIKDFAHIAIPFAKDNPHYGQHGDYIYASHIGEKNVVYGSYNKIEVQISSVLNRIGLSRIKKRTLTYNPDFEMMVEEIFKFIAVNHKKKIHDEQEAATIAKTFS